MPDRDAAEVAPAERYNLVVPRSRCPNCNAEITALQNIPVVSWLLLGGKCASLQGPDLGALPARRIRDGRAVGRRGLAFRLALADRSPRWSSPGR